MKKALVFLRSFGDFTIAISVLRKSSILEGYDFYASKHLEPLYIDLKNSFPDIDEVEAMGEGDEYRRCIF